MRSRLPVSCVVLSCVLVACAPDEPTSEVAVTQQALFNNGGFESGPSGATPPAPWVVTPLLNSNGFTPQTPQTYAGLNLSTQGAACSGSTGCGMNGSTCVNNVCIATNASVTLTSPSGALTQPDATLGTSASLRWPRYGNQCAVVNQNVTARNVNQLSQVMTIGAGDVDPLDGKVHVRLVLAPVLQDPGHQPTQQPYVFVRLLDLTNNTVVFSDFNEEGAPWQTIGTANNTYRYTDWRLVDVTGASLAMGDQVQLQVLAAGCSLGSHSGWVYVDGVGAQLPGLTLEGAAPARVNAGANLTFTLTWRNGSASTETGVQLDFSTPPNTTFVSFTSPPGATCTTPTTGSAGTVNCTFSNPMPAGASGSFTVTVNVNAATTGAISCGNYGAASNQETHLLGNLVVTQVGCAADSECAANEWCNATANACTPRLANGAPMPVDPVHPGVVLNGTCSVAAGSAVCTSGVCDPHDNKCGLLTDDGPCSSAMVCRSGLCASSGPKTGLCVQCLAEADCAASPMTPVCDAAALACVACGGDFGSGNSAACTSAGAPMCGVSGACVKCMTDGECMTGVHAGPKCDTSSGACVPAPDAGLPDAGQADAGGPDAGSPDGGTEADAGQPDAGEPDAGVEADAGLSPDAGASDAGTVDAGTTADAGAMSTDAGSTGTTPASGCGCSSSSSAEAMLALGLLLARRRSGR